MANIKTNYLTLKQVENELQNTIVSSFLSNITLLSNVDLLFSFSHYRKEKLLISLNHTSPFISLIEINESYQTIPSPLNDTLRKEVKDTKLTSLTLSPNDRIFELKFDFQNELFEKETRYLILELIPTKPNLIILNGDRKIIFATHYKDITKDRPILKNQTYTSPKSFIKTEGVFASLPDFKNDVVTYFEDIKNRRLKTKYNKLFNFISKKIKSLEKKIINIKNDIALAKEKLIYKDCGDLMYVIFNEPCLIKEYLENGLLIDYDESMDLKGNANRYFKIYKKAKATISYGEIEIDKALEEIKYYQHLKIQIENGNDDDIFQVESLVFQKQSNNKKVKSHAINPYFVIKNNIKIYFGKSDLQNEKLTFEIAKKDYYFFHIKDYPGSHVVVFNESLSNEMILTACELCLILSKRDDGEINYTQIKNVYKGKTTGQAILKTFKTIRLNSVREETKKIVKSASR